MEEHPCRTKKGYETEYETPLSTEMLKVLLKGHRLFEINWPPLLSMSSIVGMILNPPSRRNWIFPFRRDIQTLMGPVSTHPRFSRGAVLLVIGSKTDVSTDLEIEDEWASGIALAATLAVTTTAVKRERNFMVKKLWKSLQCGREGVHKLWIQGKALKK